MNTVEATKLGVLLVTQDKLTDTLGIRQEFAITPSSYSSLNIQQSNFFLLFYVKSFTDSGTIRISRQQAASRAEIKQARKTHP